MTLFGTRQGGQSVDSLRIEWCNVQTRDKGIDIKTISHPELMVIAFTVTRLCESAALHIATGSQMRMTVDCFRGTVFNWCDAVLANIKGQLTRAKNRRLKTFGYGALVVSFCLERVLMLIPQHLTVEGTEIVQFTLEYFHWLENQVFAIQDFP